MSSPPSYSVNDTSPPPYTNNQNFTTDTAVRTVYVNPNAQANNAPTPIVQAQPVSIQTPNITYIQAQPNNNNMMLGDEKPPADQCGHLICCIITFGFWCPIWVSACLGICCESPWGEPGCR